MADLTVTRGGPFGTFDLASAYADAEQVKWMQQRRQMFAQAAEQEQQQQQDLAHAQQTWAELQASKSNPAWRKQIADRVRAAAPQLASATDEEVVRFAEVGIAQKLGIDTNPDPIGNLYAVDEGGQPVYRPAAEAAGKPKYMEPERERAPTVIVPPAEQRLFDWFQGLTPEQQAG